MKKRKHSSMATAGAILLVMGLFLSFQKPDAGENTVLQFILSALPWLLLGSGVACVLTGYTSDKKK